MSYLDPWLLPYYTPWLFFFSFPNLYCINFAVLKVFICSLNTGSFTWVLVIYLSQLHLKIILHFQNCTKLFWEIYVIIRNGRGEWRERKIKKGMGTETGRWKKKGYSFTLYFLWLATIYTPGHFPGNPLELLFLIKILTS